MCRKAVRRKLALGNDYSHFQFLRHGEDLVQSLMILLKCKKVVFIDSILYNYRIVSSSISHNKKITDFSEDFAARECVFKILQECAGISTITMKKYKAYCTKKFMEILLNILMLDTPDFEKKEILFRLKDYPWNSEYISKPLEMELLSLPEKIVRRLFENGAIMLLIYIAKLKKIAKQI